MSMPTKWENRLFHHVDEENQEWYSLREVFYDNNDKPVAVSTPLEIVGTSVVEIQEYLFALFEATKKTPLESKDHRIQDCYHNYQDKAIIPSEALQKEVDELMASGRTIPWEDIKNAKIKKKDHD